MTGAGADDGGHCQQGSARAAGAGQGASQCGGEGDHDHGPGEQHDRDQDEVFEEGDRAQHLADLAEQGERRLEPDRSNIAGPHQVGRRQGRGASLDAECRKAFEQDVRQEREISEDERKEANIEDFLEQSRNHV